VPVVVTGASGLVGAALVPLLPGAGAEVRAVVRDRRKAEPLREAGAKAAAVSLDDAETLAVVMDGAHTVCHLVGGLDLPDETYDEVNVGTTRLVLDAALEAKVARFVYLSYPGASPDSANAYLRAKGVAEALVRDSGLEHAILRATHVYGRGSTWLGAMASAARGRLSVVIGTGAQRLAPVFVEDVARTLAAADDRGTEVRATYGLQGPDEVTADELADLLAERLRRKLRVGPDATRRLARLTGRPASRTMLEVLAADSLADAPDAATEFGIDLTPLAAGLEASERG
jgi:uncharacterized protein YbjT (DUF2867 family)